MKTGIIVQARMTSTRLPGKILKSVLGKPLLEIQIERLRRAAEAQAVIIATTENESDRPIWELCQRLEVPVFRGDEQDVLSRYLGAASKYGTELVVRCTSDCPLIDPAVVDRVIRFFKDHPTAYDYVSNTVQRSYPRGMDTEVFPFSLLELMARAAKEPYEREHVTPYLYRRPQTYRIGQIVHSKDESRHRWTVDTPEDFDLIELILKALYPANPHFTMKDALELLETHPDWSRINAHVVQKALNPDR